MNYVRLWLYILFALVFLMVILGGLTRLTDSGLSITEWKPLTGALPPISVEGWLIEFQKYSEIPEFKLQNSDMSLSEFKVIYWWEWGHRQLGRIIGLVWFVGFFLLLGLRKFNKELIWQSLLIGFLIGVQGGIGWWMVSSGLEEGMLDVASYRLSIHLLTAFFILSLIYWRILRIHHEYNLSISRSQFSTALYFLSIIMLLVLYIQIFSGGLVAGIDAGTAYNEWPLMNGQVLPDESFDLLPIWINFFHNSALVQFNHRILGYLLFFLVLIFFIIAKYDTNPAIKRSSFYLIFVATLQVCLGIITILSEAELLYAALHQAGGMIFLIAVLNSLFMSSRYRNV